jgi:uncharacterized protein (TIGR02145 family)
MKNFKFTLLTAGLVLAMALTFSCSGSGESAFVGKWVRDDGSESIELFKDGTGVAVSKENQDVSMSMSWILVEKRFVTTFTIQGSLVSQAYDYEISAKKLKLTDDKGKIEIFVKPQEGKIEGKTLTDSRDGKKYRTVVIGERTWMAENLNYEADGSKCYDNKPENCNKYGRLYDWNTAMKACPSGWHLPSDDEWAIDGYVGGEAGKKLKSKSGWNNDGNGTDEYGFSALPGGNGYSDGSFDYVGDVGNWWSASENEVTSDIASSLYMNYSLEDAFWDDNFKSRLLSVRCLQD